MISMSYRSPRGLLRMCLRDHLVVSRDVIMMSVVAALTMIRMIGDRCRFGQGIADVVRNRLTCAVISTVANPAGQLRHRGPGGVVGD